MNKRSLLIVVFLSVLGLANISAISSDPVTEGNTNNDYAFHLEKDEDGIKVYVRKMKTIKTREFKAVLTVNSTLDGIVALIKDESAGKEWIQRLNYFKSIKTVNDKIWYTYSEIDIPWPFDDRDLITRNTITQDSITKIVTVTLVSEPRFIAEKEDLVRMQKSEGAWILKPLGNGKVEVTYTIYSEPVKVIIPPSFILPFIVNGIHESVDKLRTIVERDKYQKTSFSYIKS